MFIAGTGLYQKVLWANSSDETICLDSLTTHADSIRRRTWNLPSRVIFIPDTHTRAYLHDCVCRRFISLCACTYVRVRWRAYNTKRVFSLKIKIYINIIQFFNIIKQILIFWKHEMITKITETNINNILLIWNKNSRLLCLIL